MDYFLFVTNDSKPFFSPDIKLSLDWVLAVATPKHKKRNTLYLLQLMTISAVSVCCIFRSLESLVCEIVEVTKKKGKKFVSSVMWLSAK